MSIIDARAAMAEEMRKLFAGFQLQDGDGVRHAINVYEQDLPVQTDDDDESSFVPYILVWLDNGDVTDWNAGEAIKLALVVCTYNLEEDGTRGSDDVLNVIGTVVDRFSHLPYFGGQETPGGVKYRFEVDPKAGGIHWELDSEEARPYFRGGIRLPVKIPGRFRGGDNINI